MTIAYIAAPLFNDAEKAFNLLVDAALREIGLDTWLPQRDGGEAAPLVRQGLNENTVRTRLFEMDCDAIRRCGVFVFVLDGRVPDEGGCVELGMAYARGVPCFGLQTDSRRFGGTDSNNLMIDYALTGGTARSIPELAELVRAHLEGAQRCR
ncbi:nucleoside 2-deoxyribosyltransferase-like protein [Lentzea atacamensis]|uniref:Nucleoside 2-deoxyribosyltransferase-like protein n=1 Tax=Lentzea atacamensis TaxID=531938 RepID=A0ABX9DXY8_9PSEU|nr:nucleoside 2-deoxyribosyltransferase [Lentzea atacamensis]RAS59418.1 nucleoside 2-deoxyribosyltransferase-like protein [Lentzea atacamensis]